MAIETQFRLAFLFLLVALFAMRFFFMFKVRKTGGRLTPDKEAVKREGKLSVIIRAIGFFALIAFLVMYLLGAKWIQACAFPLPPWLRWTGFALGLVTVAFWTWTQVTLDTQWSAQLQLKQEHKLITSGPYAFIRHPLYAGMLGWALSLALLTANWIFVGICVLSFAGLLWRVPKEEQMMIDAFGDEYRDYMKRTGRYFPKL
jgi:protein-S-isoprenylcysteine O-methyltransferase Ste14